MDILKFITAGSVDDGKSTLIGRLLYDSKSILNDQLEAISKTTKANPEGNIDLALLTDGLRAEREQGITIDVAYKYFSTPKRKFIIADAPGHIQYTRNMITGASNSDLIVILIDARQGVVEQTRRHSIIASLLNIPHVVVTINKMDLVDYNEEIYNKIVNDFDKVVSKLNLKDVTYIPISALNGDNIVEKSDKITWYNGKPLLPFLEDLSLAKNNEEEPSRFQVQYVIRPQGEKLHDYRGYAGKITSGIYKKGDHVKVLPSGLETKISTIEINQTEVETAYAPQSIVLHFEDDIDIVRGDQITNQNSIPTVSNEFDVLICWMDEKPLVLGNKFLLQQNSKRIRAVIKKISYKIDVNTLEKISEVNKINLNDIFSATIKTSSPIAYDSYYTLPSNGSAILIDETSNLTSAACMII
ncbi:MAG: GTP-binding protein [Chitinophagaceae bacterium]|nr:GTP-binding protein [Chitinophagaceae bacterium]MCU0382527.1 GTP-binding protein [Cyclobacteriaceae bacterium]